MSFGGNEPAVVAGGITAAIQLGLAMAVTMGWLHLTEVQTGSIMAFVTALFAIFVRQSVVPVSLARERMASGNDPLTPRD